MDHSTMDTLRDFVSGTGVLEVTPCEASFPAHGGQTMQMGVQNFGNEFQNFRDWNGGGVSLDNLFSGPGIDLNIGEPLPTAPAGPSVAHVAPRKPAAPGLS